jgi:hypothetical protein
MDFTIARAEFGLEIEAGIEQNGTGPCDNRHGQLTKSGHESSLNHLQTGK